MNFESIIGNDNIKLQLQIACEAAKINNTSVPHVLFAGAAGCGKTSMSNALAEKLESNLIKLPAESIKKSEDILDISEKMCYAGYNKYGNIVGQIKPSILFLDEIHKLPLGGQEALGIAMEEWYVATKNKWTKQVSEVWLPKFTVIGATTMEGKLSKPIRDRFKMTYYFNIYGLKESIDIVKIHAKLKGINITENGAIEVAKRGRGVPRILVGLLDNCLAAATVMRADRINKASAEATFDIMKIDKTGLTEEDITVLKALYDNGAPVGLDTLSVITNMSPQTIKDAKEPLLIQRNLIRRTGGGRIITKEGIDYLKELGYIETNRTFRHE